MKKHKINFIRVSPIIHGLFRISFIKNRPYKNQEYELVSSKLDRFLTYANEVMEVYPYVENGRISLEIFPL